MTIKCYIYCFIALWIIGVEAVIEFLGRIEMIGKAECLAHVGQEEAIP